MTCGDPERPHKGVGSFYDELKRLEAEAARHGHDFLAHLLGVAAREAAEIEENCPDRREGSLGN